MTLNTISNKLKKRLYYVYRSFLENSNKKFGRGVKMYLSETEALFRLTGSELGKEESKLRDRGLPSAEDNKIYTESHTHAIRFSVLNLCVYVSHLQYMAGCLTLTVAWSRCDVTSRVCGRRRSPRRPSRTT